jgi:hypothetical protein
LLASLLLWLLLALAPRESRATLVSDFSPGMLLLSLLLPPQALRTNANAAIRDSAHLAPTLCVVAFAGTVAFPRRA